MIRLEALSLISLVRNKTNHPHHLGSEDYHYICPLLIETPVFAEPKLRGHDVRGLH